MVRVEFICIWEFFLRRNLWIELLKLLWLWLGLELIQFTLHESWLVVLHGLLLISYFTRDIPGFQKTIADKYSSIDALKKLSASLEGIKSPKDEILHKLIEYIRGANRDEKILVYSHSVVYLERLEREMNFKPEFKHVLVKGE